ncbi:MAG: hypothetical protein Q8909_08500 [Bacteroidota bacterium]|nr:hypothetical protein [Bacteroidota bacterium]
MMKIKFAIIAVVLILSIDSVSAKKAPGFIIKHNCDTIFGEVNISFFDPYSGGFVFYGINLEPFQSVLYFRENNSTRFTAFTPKDIAGFGFTYKSVNYRFKTLLVEYRSIIRSERKRLRFLNLIYQGQLSLYKEIVRKESYFTTGAPNRLVDYYDYYLYDDKHGLKRVIPTKEFRTLKDMLQYYGMHPNFIEILPSDARFKDVKYFLEEYDLWKRWIYYYL